MLWKNLEPELNLPSINSLLVQNSYLLAIDVLINSISSPQIFILRGCWDSVYNHLLSDKSELGGILIGNTYSLPNYLFNEYGFVTIIKKSVPSLEFKNSSVSLRMNTEIWNRARVHTGKDELILGWYHSHPNLGAFFSGIDRKTQKYFFNQNYSIGLVVDPLRSEYEIFYGEDSDKINSKLRIINNLNKY